MLGTLGRPTLTAGESDVTNALSDSWPQMTSPRILHNLVIGPTLKKAVPLYFITHFRGTSSNLPSA